MGGLIWFNLPTKRDVIRRTYKIIGPTVPSLTRPEYANDEAGNITATTMTQDTATDCADANGYKYLTCTMHRDDDDYNLYKNVDVPEEVVDDDDGPLTVPYRR